MTKKNKIVKIAALLLASSLFVGNVANAASYTDFKYIFNYLPAAPTNANHVSQTVEVLGNANANAYAKCTAYSYQGNKPILTVVSVSTKYPTNSTSFTGTTSSGQKMKYTESIPIANKSVIFQGKVTNYTAFTIKAQVKG